MELQVVVLAEIMMQYFLIFLKPEAVFFFLPSFHVFKMFYGWPFLDLLRLIDIMIEKPGMSSFAGKKQPQAVEVVFDRINSTTENVYCMFTVQTH